MATILIVEDERQTNEAIGEYLRATGHRTVSAYDGTAALALFAQETVDLVVLDIMLPKVTGLGVLREIRKKSSVPILMLTGHSAFAQKWTGAWAGYGDIWRCDR